MTWAPLGSFGYHKDIEVDTLASPRKKHSAVNSELLKGFKSRWKKRELGYILHVIRETEIKN